VGPTGGIPASARAQGLKSKKSTGLPAKMDRNDDWRRQGLKTTRAAVHLPTTSFAPRRRQQRIPRTRSARVGGPRPSEPFRPASFLPAYGAAILERWAPKSTTAPTRAAPRVLAACPSEPLRVAPPLHAGQAAVHGLALSGSAGCRGGMCDDLDRRSGVPVRSRVVFWRLNPGRRQSRPTPTQPTKPGPSKQWLTITITMKIESLFHGSSVAEGPYRGATNSARAWSSDLR